MPAGYNKIPQQTLSVTSYMCRMDTLNGTFDTTFPHQASGFINPVQFSEFISDVNWTLKE